MINLITGVPGSGKTYLAVKFIYDEVNSKEPKYKFIYTNINLNFDKCDKYKKDFVKPLKLDDLMQRIEKDYELSELFKNNKLYEFYIPFKIVFSPIKPNNFSLITYLPDFSKYFKLVTDYDSYVRGKLKLFEPYEYSLIILDECHLYFDSNVDKKLLRFLSYHRHFDIDMYLITQNKSLINRKYLAFVENMYIGENPSKRLFSKVFVYKLYASYKESKNNLVSKEKIKFDKKIADCYNSGSTKIHKSLAYKLLIPIFIMAIFTFLAFKALTNKFKCGHFICDEPKKVVQIENKGKKVETKSTDIKNFRTNNKHKARKTHVYDLSEYKYFYVLECFNKKCILNSSFSVSRALLTFILQSSDHLLVAVDNSKIHSTYYVATNFDLFKFLRKQGGYDENENDKKIHYSVFGDK